MTQYISILGFTLGLNILALAYRCQWHNANLGQILQNIVLWLRRRQQQGRRRSSHHHHHHEKTDELHHGDNNNKLNGESVNGDGDHHKDDDDRSSLLLHDNNSSHHMSSSQREMKRRHSKLLYRIFLPVYLLATTADWLQGPYKYAVYSAYGYSQHDISVLFVAGFGSGMSLGSIVGGMADTYGRKRMACVYCVCYTFSCLAKHFRPFWILLLGRILGGIATSLLFSVFDAWLIKAHTLQTIDKTPYLSESFSASNFGSSIVAILAGLVANAIVGTTADSGSHSTLRPAFPRAEKQWYIEEAAIAGEISLGPPTTYDDPRWDVAWVYKGGGIAAFDLALVPLALCCLLAIAFWDENYGDTYGTVTQKQQQQNNTTTTPSKNQQQRRKSASGSGLGMLDGLKGASITIWRSTAIFGLCAVTSFFEGAMYVFILLWTPALRALDVHPEITGDDGTTTAYPGPPLGIVFATFMVCCMLGTSVFSILSTKGIQPSRILVFVLALSSLSCLIIATTTSDTMSYGAMLLFEGCIGAYYPAMSTVKGSIVPEDQRAAIYSVFRLPMNFVVLINLFSNLGFQPAFGLCFVMLGVATILQIRVVKYTHSTSTTTTSFVGNAEGGGQIKSKTSEETDTELESLMKATIETTDTSDSLFYDDEIEGNL